MKDYYCLGFNAGRPCRRCLGSGKIVETRNLYSWGHWAGRGVFQEPCPGCAGSGREPELENLRVLIIDDEPSICEGLCTLLEKDLPSQVIAVNSLALAYGLEDFIKNKIRLLILDDQLRDGRSGFNSIGELRKAFPSCAIVMIGALLELRSSAAYAMAGVRTVIPKPWFNDTVVRTVREYLNRS
jgi:CheY-like chemotaxis protein